MNPKTFQKVNKSNTRKLRINEGPAKQDGERLLTSVKIINLRD